MKPQFTIDRPAAVERLERIRRFRSMSKRQFALSLGMLASNYSRLLKGDIFLTVDQLYAAWQLYGADPSYIMGGNLTQLPRELVDRILQDTLRGEAESKA